MAGVYVANAGATGTGATRILKQTVTVNGMVTGGTDAAVHLVGGGRLTVGEMGVVRCRFFGPWRSWSTTRAGRRSSSTAW